MTKVMRIEVSDDTYYKLVELKGKFKADSWTSFMNKIIEQHEV